MTRAVPAVATLLLVGAVLASLAVGRDLLGPAQLWSALTAFTGSDVDRVVLHLRVPRTAAGLLAGLGLGLAGALVQGLTRNPLGDPGLLGLTSGAALAAAAALLVLGPLAPAGYAVAAVLGAAGAAAAVAVLHRRAGGGPLALALTGAVVAALLGALTSAIALHDPGTFERFRFWLVGSLTRADLAVVGQVAPLVLAGAVLALALARGLDALALGGIAAAGLGEPVRRTGLLGVLAVVLLAGGATALAGPVAFVGLAAPHLARLLTGPGHRVLLPLAGVLGALLVLAADVAGRVLLAPEEIQVGVSAAVLGAPVLLALLRRGGPVR